MKQKFYLRQFFLLTFFILLISCSFQKKDKNKKEVLYTGNTVITGAGHGPSGEIRAKLSSGASDGIPGIFMDNFNTEEYGYIRENLYKNVMLNPLSTFSIDVDNASYSNIRRYLNLNQLPPKDAVRIEEMINYFEYDYAQPEYNKPFSVNLEVGNCPWNDAHKLVHIGLQGRKPDFKNLKPSNLVFLIDVSGSMKSAEKLPLLKDVFKLLVQELGEKDRIAIVTYAGAAGLVLPSTSASEKQKIIASLDSLSAGGSTAGGEGILLAYKVAKENLIKNGNNRVILATDGDFNVGLSGTGDLVRLIEEKRRDDIYLTICGFGMGNYKDERMEEISNAGNGNYFYIDDYREGEKVFRRDLRANFFTIAKDVKIQIEFNPRFVESYRLVGYENRVMPAEDFNDDKKDAGELGPGHSVTALYEILPAPDSEKCFESKLKYQSPQFTEHPSGKTELLTLKLRYKNPDEDKSRLIERSLKISDNLSVKMSENYTFAASVAGFGMLLRGSDFKGSLTYAQVIKMAETSLGSDPGGYRAEYLDLVKMASQLSNQVTYKQ